MPPQSVEKKNCRGYLKSSEREETEGKMKKIVSSSVLRGCCISSMTFVAQIILHSIDIVAADVMAQDQTGGVTHRSNSRAARVEVNEYIPQSPQDFLQ